MKLKEISKRFLKSRTTYREAIRDSKKVTIVEDQPIHSKDKSRYFKTAWEEERRQLFFR